MKLNNGLEIPQIGVGTWTLCGETARQNVCLALQAGFRYQRCVADYRSARYEPWRDISFDSQKRQRPLCL